MGKTLRVGFIFALGLLIGSGVAIKFNKEVFTVCPKGQVIVDGACFTPGVYYCQK